MSKKKSHIHWSSCCHSVSQSGWILPYRYKPRVICCAQRFSFGSSENLWLFWPWHGPAGRVWLTGQRSSTYVKLRLLGNFSHCDCERLSLLLLQLYSMSYASVWVTWSACVNIVRGSQKFWVLWVDWVLTCYIPLTNKTTKPRWCCPLSLIQVSYFANLLLQSRLCTYWISWMSLTFENV